MNSFVKVLLIIAAIIGALWWLAVGVLHWTADAQTRAILEQLNQSEELTFDADQIRLHLDGVGVRNLHVRSPDGDQLRIDRGRLSAAPWPLLWKRELHIREISIRNLVFEPSEALVQLWREPPDEAASPEPYPGEPPQREAETRTVSAAPEPFAGLLQGGRSGTRNTLGLRIRRADVQGTLRLPDEQYVAMQVRLRDFRPGREARLEAMIETTLAELEDFPILDGRVHAESRIRTHRDGFPANIEGHASINLLAQGNTEAVDLHLEFSALDAGTEERYRLRIRREGFDAALVDFQGRWSPRSQRSDGQLLVALNEAAVTGLPTWGHFQTPLAEGLLEYAVGAKPDDDLDRFRLNGSADLRILIDLFDTQRRGQLRSGTINVNLDGRIHDTAGTAAGEIRVDDFRPAGHTDAPFSGLHQLHLEADESGMQVNGPIQLTGPITTSQGQLRVTYHADDDSPDLHLELDRFDEQEWQPVLDLFPEVRVTHPLDAR